MNSPLTPLGIKQAELLADYLQNMEISKIYSSDLGRAIDTAKTISKNLNLPTEEVAELREIKLGEWEGKKADEIISKDQDLYYHWFRYPSQTIIPQAESISKFSERIIPAFYQIINKHKDEIIAIVSHGGAIITFLAHLLKVELDYIYWMIEISNASVSVFEFYEDNYFRLINLNNTDFLKNNIRGE